MAQEIITDMRKNLLPGQYFLFTYTHQCHNAIDVLSCYWCAQVSHRTIFSYFYKPNTTVSILSNQQVHVAFNLCSNEILQFLTAAAG